jgi:hypothetical protein
VLSIGPQSNVADPRRRPRTVLLYPSPHRMTRQYRRPSLSRCPRPQCRLQRAARRAIGVGVVVVADPPPKRRIQRRWRGRRVSLALSVSSQIGVTHFGNRRRWRCSRPEQPTLWRWSLSDHWLSAQPKLGRSSHTAYQWIRGICLSPTCFFLPVVFVITTTATATADIVGSARLPCPFGANSAEQDATTTAVTWLWRGTRCASSVAWEAHERR